METCPPSDAVTLLSAWGRLQALNPSAFEAVSSVLLQEGDANTAPVTSLGETDLREVAVAFARARWAYHPMLQAAATVLSSRREGTAMWQLQVSAPALAALSRLRWRHPALEQYVEAALLQLEECAGSASGLAKQGPRVAHLSAQALQASWLLDASPTWLQCAEITARRLLDYGPASIWSTLSSHKSGASLVPDRWHESQEEGSPEFEGRSSRCWERELLFGSLALAFATSSSQTLGRALFECLPPEAATPHIAFSALVLQSQGLLSHGALRPLRRPLSEALESGGCAPAVRSVDPDSTLEACHEPGYRGRELPKEAHTIAKVLARLGGPHVPLPLRRPWIVRPAGLSVHLLLPPRDRKSVV